MSRGLQVIGDLRSGVRALRKYPMLSIVAIVTFGLGLGLSTTVFSIVNGALFKGLPFEEPDRVVALFDTKPSEHDSSRPIPVQDLPLWQARQTVLDIFGAYDRTSINLSTDEGRPERVSAGQLTVAAFQALRVKPVLGRGFEPGDDQFGAPPVILLGDDVWRSRFGASRDVVNTMLRTNGLTRRVIGVMPPRFGFPELESVWVPLQFNPHGTPRGKGPNYPVIARLKHGVSVAQARVQVEAIAAGLAQEFPETNQGVSADVQPFAETVLWLPHRRHSFSRVPGYHIRLSIFPPFVLRGKITGPNSEVKPDLDLAILQADRGDTPGLCMFGCGFIRKPGEKATRRKTPDLALPGASRRGGKRISIGGKWSSSEGYPEIPRLA